MQRRLLGGFPLNGKVPARGQKFHQLLLGAALHEYDVLGAVPSAPEVFFEVVELSAAALQLRQGFLL